MQILANPNDVVHLVYRAVHECQGHSLYCHLNASHLRRKVKTMKIPKVFNKSIQNKLKSLTVNKIYVSRRIGSILLVLDVRW